MSSLFKYIKQAFRPEFFIYSLIAFLVLSRGAIYELDSYAFLSMEINRSPGYMLFLSFFQKIFGQFFEYPLLITQLGLNLFAVHILHTCLIRTLELNRWFSIFTLLILSAPLVYLYQTPNKILTEALAYPFYLIFMANCLQGIVKEEKRNLIYATAILLALVLIRGQFVSLVPVGLILALYLTKITTRKKFLLVGLLFLTVPFLSNLLDKSFHYYKYGYFISTPFTGSNISAAVFYVSDKEDVSLFNSIEEKEYFKLVKEKLDKEQWTNSFANSYDSISSFAHFSKNYVNICNQTIHEYGLQYFKKKGFSNNMQQIATDDLLMKMYKPLLLDNFKKWLKLYIQNIKASLGNSKYLLLHIIFFGIGIFLILKRKDFILGQFMVFSILCIFSNMLIVAIATHSEKRYIFYNDWVLFIILFVFVDRYFKFGIKEKI